MARDDAYFIKRAYCRALWRERGWLDRLKLLALLATWPLVFGISCLWLTLVNGPAIKRRHGVSILRQVAGQAEVALLHGTLPQWYYMFDMWDADLRAEAAQFIHRYEMKGGLYGLMLDPRAIPTLPNLSDKIAFAERCQQHGLPIAEEYLKIGGGAAPSALALPDDDLFIKPFDGRGGSGAQSWVYASGKYTSVGTGETIGKSELFDRLAQSPVRMVVQSRMVNHIEVLPLSNGALVTARIMTFLTPEGEHVATHAGLRMARGTNKLVDNFHAGGIIAAVDMATGRLGPATDIGLRPEFGWRDTHPDTGGAITGKILPMWQETVALACRAHKAFAPRVVVGWDIAITAKGPVIVEGNSAPDVDLLQRSHRSPLGGSAYCKYVAHHLRQQPATRLLIGEDA
jgi:Sugar-transfer associated ATP-grasp